MLKASPSAEAVDFWMPSGATSQASLTSSAEGTMDGTPGTSVSLRTVPMMLLSTTRSSSNRSIVSIVRSLTYSTVSSVYTVVAPPPSPSPWAST